MAATLAVGASRSKEAAGVLVTCVSVEEVPVVDQPPAMGRDERGKGMGSGKGGTSQGPNSSGSVQVLRRPRPAPGPGKGMTRVRQRDHWRTMGPRTDIVDFYGHNWRAMQEWAVFSNFYDQSSCPFDFEVPLAFCACNLSDSDRVVCCDFSEKAVMLCKAAAMGDVVTYGEIAKAKSPDVAKRLGRQVVGFDEDIWASILCSVAFHVVLQKFAKTPQLQKHLLKGLSGEDQPTLFAEMTERDSIWGTGMDWQDRRAKNPSKWPGTNILGWALTQARDLLLVGKGHEYFAPLLAMQEAEILGDMRREQIRDVPPAASSQAELEVEAAAASKTADPAKEQSIASKEQSPANKLFRYVSGVLDGTLKESMIAEHLGDAHASFASACDALADAIDAHSVPAQGMAVLLGLADRLPAYGVAASDRLPGVLQARKGESATSNNADGAPKHHRRWQGKRV